MRKIDCSLELSRRLFLERDIVSPSTRMSNLSETETTCLEKYDKTISTKMWSIRKTNLIILQWANWASCLWSNRMGWEWMGSFGLWERVWFFSFFLSNFENSNQKFHTLQEASSGLKTVTTQTMLLISGIVISVLVGEMPKIVTTISTLWTSKIVLIVTISTDVNSVMTLLIYLIAIWFFQSRFQRMLWFLFSKKLCEL